MSRRMARLERRDKRMSFMRVALLLGLAVLVLGMLYRLGTGAVSALSRLHRNVEVARFGTLEDKLTGPAIVINKENVVPATADGHFDNMVKEQEKISKGILLGYLVTSQSQVPLRAQESGTFMRQIDGLEDVMQNIDLQSVTPEVFKYKPTPVKADQAAVAGQPLYKIVDSLEPNQLLLHFPLKDVDFEVEPQQQVKIRWGGRELENAVITDMKQDFGELLLMIRFKGFQEELLAQRFIEVEAVFNSYSGYMIPEKALVGSGGEKGIYCSNGEDISFKPVKILKTKDDICIVEGLQQNEMYVTNPPQSK
ncbi:MAG: HlyD family efflux transporter periplasmic adaptor subunit [Syntrophomonadaceae bacterium]|nr:HlyD family efflux transporter periplasmic adaptor subunit [Syntrophomonadaceae bacterium]